MTTPYGQFYLNQYLNQGNPFNMMGMSGMGYGINCGYGYSSNYSSGMMIGNLLAGTASMFANIFMTRAFASSGDYGYYEGGGGGSRTSVTSGIQDDIDDQLDILNKEGGSFDEKTYTSATVEEKYTKAVSDADKDITKYTTDIDNATTELSTNRTALFNKKAEFAKFTDADKTNPKYHELEDEIRRLDEAIQTLDSNIREWKEAKRKAELAKEKAEQAVSTRTNEINNAITKLKGLYADLKEEQSNPVTLDAELNYSDGNWIQRQGKGENAKARQAIRDFRKAKQDYDAMPDGPMKDAELVNLKDIAYKALHTTETCKIKDLDGSVKSGLAFIRNWYDTQK